MISNKDIFAVAQQLINKYGDNAFGYADKRMRELMVVDDAKGASVWLSIGQAISDLQKTSTKDKLH